VRSAARSSDHVASPATGTIAGFRPSLSALGTTSAGVAHHSAAGATNDAPSLPGLPDRGSAFGAPGAAGGSGLTGSGLLAALIALSLLAAPRLGRRLRPTPDRRSSPAFVLLLERPG
jgi:hypothetical protein